MGPPRKTGSGSAGDDPEKETPTAARAQNPLVEEEDPERAEQTVSRARPGARKPAGADDDDPERGNLTVSRAKRAGGKPAAEDPERHAQTQARVASPTGDRPALKSREYRTASNYEGGPEVSDYSTGNNYQPLEDEPMAGSLSLEGDGLDPVDPEMAPRTSAQPALESDEEAPPPDEDDEQNLTQAGPPLVLEIVSGPDQGKKKKFKGVRMVIGRTPGIDLQLSDQSVSRRHVELVHSDKGVLLRDLGSGNGTKVNGQKVAEKMLEHGDEIGIGKTRIRFIDEVAAFKKAAEAKEKAEAEEKARAEAGEQAGAEPAEEEGAEGEEGGEGEEDEEGEEDGAPEGDEEEPGDDEAGEEDGEGDGPQSGGGKAPRRPRGPPPARGDRAEAKKSLGERFRAMPPPLRIGLVGGLAALVLLVALAIALRKPPPPPVDPNRAAADAKLQAARNVAHDAAAATELQPAFEKFEEMVRLVEQAEELSPGIDKTKLGNQAREAVAALRGLLEAKELVEKRRFEDARKALDKVATPNPTLEDHKSRVQQALDEAQLAYRLEKIDEFLASGDLDSAKALLAELPVEAQPGPSAKVAEFERELEEQRKLEARDAARNAANASAAARQRREEEIALAFAIVDRKFAGAEWDRAASECTRVIDEHTGDREIVARAKQIASLIPNFGRNYEEGIKKYKQGNLAGAARPLRAAWHLYGQIGLRANPYGGELSQRLAEASVAAGREALLRDDLASAAVNFRDATRLDPSDAKARRGLDEVVARADDLYQAAYIIKDRDPREALRKFKIVVEVTPSGSSTHEKAKNQIAAMAP